MKEVINRIDIEEIKTDLSEVVRQAWKDATYTETHKAKIIEDYAEGNIVSVLMDKINFDDITKQLNADLDQDVDQLLKIQIQDLLRDRDAAYWNISVDKLLDNPTFLDLATLAITGPVLMGDDDPCMINGDDASDPDVGNYLRDFKASLGCLNLDWTDYSTQNLNDIIRNAAQYVVDHWSSDGDIEVLINEGYFVKGIAVLSLHNDLFDRYDKMIEQRVKEVGVKPWHLTDTLSVNLTQDVVEYMQKDIRVSPMTFDFFSQLLHTAYGTSYITYAYDKTKTVFKKRYFYFD
ncbi:hypothetical protein [Limosilactobacillus mucosae]|uniref:Uncharacterized protein n=1 Tax=Limosilactobacillus mucosae TaxID=97478 RepID=A0AAJ1HNZ6_LIMMU|nr:hypothetical protein [Limosilactobacillus mucosae]MDC2826959.1 hypothetical protein [Limosilactobacillus mucosae]MDC2834674.1 hypothetical protein [Limosilactobacillus mucosae]